MPAKPESAPSADDDDEDDAGVKRTIASFAKHGIPLTRDNFLGALYPGGTAPKAKDWTIEHEMELPKRLQDWNLFDKSSHYIGPPIDEFVEDDPPLK